MKIKKKKNNNFFTRNNFTRVNSGTREKFTIGESKKNRVSTKNGNERYSPKKDRTTYSNLLLNDDSLLDKIKKWEPIKKINTLSISKLKIGTRNKDDNNTTLRNSDIVKNNNLSQNDVNESQIDNNHIFENDRTTFDESNFYLTEEFLSKTCNICQQKIDETTVYLKVKNNLVHYNCFRCSICQDLLDDQCVEKEGKWLCLKKCAILVAEKCTSCCQSIFGEYILYRGLKYHGDCLKCVDCNIPLKSEFYTINSQPYCISCGDILS